MKNTKMKNLTFLFEYNLDMFFIIVFIKKNKSKKLSSYKVRESLAFILLDKFFNYHNFMEKNAICWLFRINNFIGKSIEGK